MPHAEKVRTQLRNRIRTVLEYIDLICARRVRQALAISGRGAPRRRRKSREEEDQGPCQSPAEVPYSKNQP